MLKRSACGLLIALMVSFNAQAQAPNPWEQQQQIQPSQPMFEPSSPREATALPELRESDGARLTRETNRMRANPRAYADALASQRQWFKGTLKYVPTHRWPVQTNEGVAAVNEAIDALRQVKSPPPQLRHEPALDQVAAKHARELVKRRTLSHTGADGSRLSDRLKRAGTPQGSMGENIALGDSEPSSVIAELLIDDGVPSRGHRINLLNPAFKVAGGACDMFSEGRDGIAPQSLCVMVYATEFTPK